MNIVAESSLSPFGRLLRHWRAARGYTQLSLAVEAGISTRHLSFMETGRAQPSREMVELLAGMLDVPLDNRNELLLAAGYAPRYGRRQLEEPDLEPLNRALQFILRQQEPYPALVIDGGWDIVGRNQAAERIFGLFADEPASSSRRTNTIRTMFHPRGIRRHIVNWEEMAVRMLYKIRHEAALGVNDSAARLRDEVLSYPGVSALWRTPEAVNGPAPALMTMQLRKGDWAFSFFSTVSMLGLPCDATAQDLRVECFFPADAATDAASRRLAVESPALRRA